MSWKVVWLEIWTKHVDDVTAHVQSVPASHRRIFQHFMHEKTYTGVLHVEAGKHSCISEAPAANATMW